MPPAAFQIRNFHHGMWLIPASHAAVTRSTAMNRPMKTVFGPCRWKNRSAGGSTLAACGAVNDQRFEQLPAADPPEPVADVVADDRGGGRDDDHRPERVAVLLGPREVRGDDQCRLTGDRHAGRLDRDRDEEQDRARSAAAGASRGEV